MSRATNTASFVNDAFGEALHLKRVQSLASGALGVLHAAMLSSAAVGQAMVDIAGIKHKSRVKQIELSAWVPGSRFERSRAGAHSP